MARNDEEEIFALEERAARLGYLVVEQAMMAGQTELSDQFRWIAGNLATMRDKTLAQRTHRRQEISKRIKELGDVIREKHIQYGLLPFRCIDEHDECVRKRKRQRKSTYWCFLALSICLANSMKALLAAIAAAAGAGGLLR